LLKLKQIRTHIYYFKYHSHNHLTVYLSFMRQLTSRYQPFKCPISTTFISPLL